MHTEVAARQGLADAAGQVQLHTLLAHCCLTWETVKVSFQSQLLQLQWVLWQQQGLLLLSKVTHRAQVGQHKAEELPVSVNKGGVGSWECAGRPPKAVVTKEDSKVRPGHCCQGAKCCCVAAASHTKGDNVVC